MIFEENDDIIIIVVIFKAAIRHLSAPGIIATTPLQVIPNVRSKVRVQRLDVGT